MGSKLWSFRRLAKNKIHGKKLKYMLLNGSSQSEKAMYYVIATARHPGKGRTTGTVKRSSDFQKSEGEKDERGAQVCLSLFLVLIFFFGQ